MFQHEHPPVEVRSPCLRIRPVIRTRHDVAFYAHRLFCSAVYAVALAFEVRSNNTKHENILKP